MNPQTLTVSSNDDVDKAVNALMNTVTSITDEGKTALCTIEQRDGKFVVVVCEEAPITLRSADLL